MDQFNRERARSVRQTLIVILALGSIALVIGISPILILVHAQTPTIAIRGNVSLTTWWAAGTCKSGTASADGWQYHTAATDAPTPTCKDSAPTTSIAATLAFDDSATETIYRDVLLPGDWVSPMALNVIWYTSATTGNVVWQAATLCTAVGGSTDETAYTYNAANTVTQAAQGTTLRLNKASIAALTTTGCAAGSVLHLKFFRNPAHASDTIAATASLVGVEFTFVRAVS